MSAPQPDRASPERASAPRRLETVARPKQARAERTLHRLLDAAEALIEERGLAEVSIPDIVRRARSSVGGFYARFRDKNELLRALEERFFNEQRQRLERLTRIETWAGATLPEIVMGCARELLHVFRERRALIRAFFARSLQDREFRGAVLAFEREVAERVAALLAAQPGAIRHPRPEQAVPLAVAIVFGSMIAGVLFGDARHPFAQLSEDEAAEELARNFLGYLRLDEAFGEDLMQYVQHNPLPIPEVGEYQHVKATIDAVFDWHYELRRSKLLELYEKGKAATWNASDLDWSTDVDIEKMVAQRQMLGGGSMINQLLAPPRPLDDREALMLNLHMNAFMLSQFLHGEQGALLATAKIVESVPWAEAKYYAANQVADEARHVEVYHRYLTEKLGVSYPVHPSLGSLLDDILVDSRWDVTYLGMQIMVEGLALAAFGLQKMMMAEEPLIVDITTRIMSDESRHVAFGVISLEEVTKSYTPSELREREDFILEATHLMRERLLMQPVFERLDWPVDVWVQWAQNTPFMKGFRQMLFSKIVPNLKRLGLLTPRVRAEYEKLDLLRFEHLKDSVEDPDIVPPQELVQMLMQFMAKKAPETERATG